MILSLENIERKIKQSGDLGAVVRTMKAITAANISQYQRAVHTLDLYYRTVLSGIKAYMMREPISNTSAVPNAQDPDVLILVFGSDQGLVGPFNNVIAAFCARTTENQGKGRKFYWAIGERVAFQLSEAGIVVDRVFPVPGSLDSVTTFVGHIAVELDELKNREHIESVYTFFNRPRKGSEYTPVARQLLPFETEWKKKAATIEWESNNIAEVAGDRSKVFSALFREYLFSSLYRACVFSLASENASRLSAMQRAEKNIEELSERLRNDYNQVRQNTIDAELFDIIAGFMAMKGDDAEPDREAG